MSPKVNGKLIVKIGVSKVCYCVLTSIIISIISIYKVQCFLVLRFYAEVFYLFAKPWFRPGDWMMDLLFIPDTSKSRNI